MSRIARMATMLAMLVLLTACGVSDHQKEALLRNVSTSILKAAVEGSPATVTTRPSLQSEVEVIGPDAGLKAGSRGDGFRVRVHVRSNQKAVCSEAKKALAFRLRQSGDQVVVVHFTTDKMTRSQPAV